ncbi:MAG TPA: type IV toxin-antitoxin system AbiEi family antitoxin domain-containing protein [Solirubrobacterales bacterium]
MPTETVKNLVEQGKSRSRGDDRPLSELARRQHGVVSRGQLLGRGLSKEEIDWRIRTGRLHPLHAGVYAVGHRLISRQGRLMAAVLTSGREAVLSHHSAAMVWGLRAYTERAIHVTAPHKSTSSKRIRRHHSLLPADERTIEEGIPVTTVPRTILDLAATEGADTVENLLRESEFRQLADRLSLPDLLERYPGKRGTRKVQVALDRLKEDPAGTKRSPLEERFAPFLRRHRLSLPRFNDWIEVGGKRYKVDCHWPDLRQVVELDGWEGHSTRTAFREDRARDRRLTAAGYTVTHLTWNQLDDEAAEVASDLRRLLLREK